MAGLAHVAESKTTPGFSFRLPGDWTHHGTDRPATTTTPAPARNLTQGTGSGRGPARVARRQSSGGCDSGRPPLCPNSLFKRGVSRLLREPLAGTTVETLPGIPGHLRAWFSQFTCMNQRGELGIFLAVFRLTREGFVGSSTNAPTFSNICRCVSAEVVEPGKSEIYLAMGSTRAEAAGRPRRGSQFPQHRHAPEEGGRCGVIQPIDAYQTGLRRLLA